MPAFLDQLRNLTLPMLASFTVGTLAAIYIAVYACRSEHDLLPLLALTGAIAGWVVGVLAAPFSPDERQHFGELAKVISGFITGYVLSKLEPVIGALVAVPEGGSHAPIMSFPVAEQILVTLSSFGVALLFVFSARLYWSSASGSRQPDTMT